MPNRVNVLVRKDLAGRLERQPHCVLISYQGLTGQEAVDLRAMLREKDVQLRVVKNSLAAMAFEDSGLAGLPDCLEGPCAVVTGGSDMPTTCKVIKDWIKSSGKMAIRAGFLDGRTILPDEVNRLAEIPPMPVLQAQFLGAIQGVPQRVAGAFQSLISSIARALEEIRKQKEGSEGGATAGGE